MINKFNKHITLTAVNDIESIVKPLLPFDITYFVYVRSFSDYSHYTLTNHAEWAKMFYPNYFDGRYTRNELILHDNRSTGFKLWSPQINNKILEDNKRYINIANGIDITRKHENYTETFSFASSSYNHKVNDFYLSNFDLLNQFIFYFKEQARPLMKDAEKNGIIIPGDTIDLSKPETCCNIKIREQFLKKTKVKRYYIDLPNREIFLTKRELDCLFWATKGKTAKETARNLHLSPRTVETHLLHCLHKFHCHSKSELIHMVNLLNIF